jgi:two-component system OmpR family response regulator
MSAKKETVIVADDDPRLLRLVQFNLQQAGYRVITASDGNRALRLAENENPDLILLDVRMPLMDGLEVCRRVRNFSTVPIIMVTAKDSEEDKVAGLDAGADDYLTKPFDFEELLARLRALIRRSSGLGASLLEIGGIEIDTAARLVRSGGEIVSLTPREYGLVEYLALHRGSVVSRTELYEHLFDESDDTLSNLLDVHVSNVRKKLGAGFISTRRGHGYSIE